MGDSDRRQLLLRLALMLGIGTALGGCDAPEQDDDDDEDDD